MADILLVHGSSHGAWCWRDAMPELTALGHQVEAIDLPSHGNDRTPVNDVTLDKYAQRILESLDRPRVVVGHSMGGFPISLVAEQHPEVIERLIYICAYVPRDGYTLAGMRKSVPRQPLVPAIVMSQDRLSFTFDPALAKTCFYGDCSDEQIAFAKAHLTPQAVAPNDVSVTLTERYSRVPRSYIRCRNDNAVPHELQVMMTDGWPKEHIVDMDSAHSPFFSKPRELAAVIDRFIRNGS